MIMNTSQTVKMTTTDTNHNPIFWFPEGSPVHTEKKHLNLAPSAGKLGSTLTVALHLPRGYIQGKPEVESVSGFIDSHQVHMIRPTAQAYCGKREFMLAVG